MAVNIVLRTDFDAKGLIEAERGLDKFKSIADKAFRGVAIGTGIAAAAFGKLAMDSIKAASNLEESTNAVNVAFGKSAEAVLAIGANSAQALGLARNEFNEAAVRFSAFAERIVGDGNDASTFIQEITQRASDFASVFNIEVAEALRVFQSGLAGEAEPLKRFGINLLQSEVQAYALANGIIEVGEQMTETEKVQARYGLLLESTAKTAGDFANTSDGLANSQRILKARFTDLQAEIGQALLPAFTDLFKAVADRVMPEMEKLGEFLRSPDGQKAISDLAETVGDLAVKFIENLDGIIRTATAIATFTVAVKLATTAVQLATTAQLLFNTAVRMNPYVLAATGLLAFVAAISAFAKNTDQSRLSAQRATYQITILDTEIDRLNDTFRSGAIDQQTYENQLKVLQQELNSVKISTEGTAGEVNRFNALRLDGAIASMEAYKNATSLAERQAKSFADSYARLEAIGAVTPRRPTETDNLPSAIVSSGPSAFEQARNKVQDLIRSSQKQLADAQKTLVNSQLRARQDYARNIANIEQEFGGRLAAIIQDSQNRLRSAYRGAVEENIAALFDRSEDKSVAGLVKSLSDKLAGSRQLLANSAQLASQGFSQTFIEQVVSAGTTTGNELASAILQSTPETQAELKNLFRAIEVEATAGMDSLSKEIFDKQGLATDELKNLYANTQGELNLALIEQQTILDESLREANDKFIESVREIKSALATQLADMKGQFGGMERTIDQFIAKLDELIAKSKQVSTGGLTIAPLPAPAGGGAPVIAFQPVPTTAPSKPTTTPTVVVNNKIVVPNQQSAAMAGKSVAKELNKYTGGGGGLRGVAFVAV